MVLNTATCDDKYIYRKILVLFLKKIYGQSIYKLYITTTL